MSWKDAILIGPSQAFAIFPGILRSGAAITAGLTLGLKRESAARFSFLLSVPIIAGAGAKSLYDLAKGHAQLGEGGSLVAIGFIVAALSGFLCVKLLMDFLKKHTTKAFIYYRWGLAALVAILQ